VLCLKIHTGLKLHYIDHLQLPKNFIQLKLFFTMISVKPIHLFKVTFG